MAKLAVARGQLCNEFRTYMLTHDEEKDLLYKDSTLGEEQEELRKLFQAAPLMKQLLIETYCLLTDSSIGEDALWIRMPELAKRINEIIQVTDEPS